MAIKSIEDIIEAKINLHRMNLPRRTYSILRSGLDFYAEVELKDYISSRREAKATGVLLFPPYIRDELLKAGFHSLVDIIDRWIEWRNRNNTHDNQE